MTPILFLVALFSFGCKTKSQSNDTNPVSTNGACVAIAPATNNVEQCSDSADKAKCESSTVAQMWPNVSSVGVNDNAKLQFVPGRMCKSFRDKSGVE